MQTRPEESTVSQRVREFAGLDEFLSRFTPLTPCGRNAKRSLTLCSSREKLEHLHALTELAMQFVKLDPGAADKAEFHLARIPLLDCLDQPVLDAAEVFLVKRFLVNYRAACQIIPASLRQETELEFTSTDLLALLSVGAQDTESFFLSDAYSQGLGQTRSSIKEVEGQLDEMRNRRRKEILDRCGLDFWVRDFVLVSDDRIAGIDRDLVFLESYDSRRLLARPIFPDEMLTPLREREQLLEQEKRLERKILDELSERISRERESLASYVGALTRLDSALARARLSLAFQMTRPRIREWGSNIEIRGGRFIPQIERCLEQELPYAEVNARFSERVIVLHGSNMGGKTVLLKSLTFFQMLAQCGFFVPCLDFSTVCFEQIHCLGSMMGETAGGLSSFGLEVHTFSQALAKKRQRALYILDEFARNTNSREARALIAAILYHFSRHDEGYAFLATHYMGLPDFAHVGYMRMKGLNHKEYEEYHASTEDQDVVERIRLISRFMEYQVEENPTQGKIHDGLRVAEILGLDKEIIENATSFLGGMDEE